MGQFGFGPVLDVLNEQYHMHAPFAGLDELEESGIGGWGGVDGVGAYPEVVSAAVDHPPHLLEKQIPVYDEFSPWEAQYLRQVPLFELLLGAEDIAVEGLTEDAVDIHCADLVY